MSDRTAVLAAARQLLVDTQPVSLDSVAQAVGLTKAGVMHYFGTKAQLMLALVDTAADDLEAELRARLGVEHPADASARDRIAAYAAACLGEDADGADLAMLADPRLRKELTARWSERLEPWLRLDEDVEPAVRGRLLAVRLLADGAWLSIAADYLAPADRDRPHLVAAIDALLGGDGS